MHEKVRLFLFFNNFNRDRAEFEKKSVDKDVIDLRYKHYQARLIDTINRIIEQRRQIKMRP